MSHKQYIAARFVCAIGTIAILTQFIVFNGLSLLCVSVYSFALGYRL